MKDEIFKSVKSDIQKKEDNLVQLIDNNLTLDKKIHNFIYSMESVILTENGIEKLLEILCNRIGYKIEYPRKGDNNQRFDAIIHFNERNIGIVEIEVPSLEILDAPRNLLDDYAVYKSRNDVTRYENIDLLVVCWDLPNNRTDYWNVLNDIYKVLNIKIRTISLLYLAVIYWLELDPLKSYENTWLLIDDENNRNNNYAELISLLKKKGNYSDEILGFFEPFK